MVMTLVVLTFVVFIALDYFVFSRQRAEAASPALVLGALPAARRVIPVGISLQPTFTWSRFGPAGEAYVGVHPMLVGLIGGACEFELLDAGQHVGRGEPLVRLAQGGRRLTVRSPIAGRVEQVGKVGSWIPLIGHKGQGLKIVIPVVEGRQYRSIWQYKFSVTINAYP